MRGPALKRNPGVPIPTQAILFGNKLCERQSWEIFSESWLAIDKGPWEGSGKYCSRFKTVPVKLQSIICPFREISTPKTYWCSLLRSIKSGFFPRNDSPFPISFNIPSWIKESIIRETEGKERPLIREISDRESDPCFRINPIILERLIFRIKLGVPLIFITNL